MSPAIIQSPLRVLIVDEDAVIRDLLARELAAAGYEVDTLSSGDGLTPDMIGLIQPDLLLVDPFLGDVPLPVVEAALIALRQGGKLKLLLIDDGRDPAQIARLVRSCRADGSISKRELLRAPVDAIAEQFLPEVELVEFVPEPPLPSADDAASDGIEIELSLDLSGPRRAPATAGAPRAAVIAKPPPPAAKSPAAKAAPAKAAPAKASILGLIQDEIGDLARDPVPAQTAYQVGINLFSRHNFYVGSTGDLRTGGLFVATAVLPEVGELLKVEIQIPFSPVVQIEGAVEWVRPGNQVGRVTAGAGVSLAHLPDAQRAILERFFKERAPLTHLPKR